MKVYKNPGKKYLQGFILQWPNPQYGGIGMKIAEQNFRSL